MRLKFIISASCICDTIDVKNQIVMQQPDIIIFFFIIALVYASMGFGGSSSYLAILALYAFPLQKYG
jgi:hypothetical protein